MIRKIQASNEVWHKLLGSIDTPEKFNAKRAKLAKNEWARMKANDSRECRNCHSFSAMDIEKQKARASKMHKIGVEDKQTCIDCHKGIAHELPDMTGIEPGWREPPELRGKESSWRGERETLRQHLLVIIAKVDCALLWLARFFPRHQFGSRQFRERLQHEFR